MGIKMTYDGVSNVGPSSGNFSLGGTLEIQSRGVQGIQIAEFMAARCREEALWSGKRPNAWLILKICANFLKNDGRKEEGMEPDWDEHKKLITEGMKDAERQS